MFSVDKIKKRLGIQILFDFDNVIDAVNFGLDNKLKVLELNLNNINFSEQIKSRAGQREINQHIRKYKIALQFHALEGLSFFVPNKDTQNFIIKSLTKTLDYASEIGVKRVTIHLGIDMSFGLTAQKKFTYEVYPDYFKKHMYDALAALRKIASRNTFLCIENVGGFRYPFVLDMIPQFLGGKLGLTIDIGHINRFKGIDKEREYNFFYNNRKYIKNCHIHDNNGKWDQHNIIGDGNIDFIPYFEFLSETDAYYIFEVRPKESAMECVKRFNRLLNKDADVHR